MSENSQHREEVDLVIEGAIVLPMTGPDHLIWDGSIAIKGDRIVAVGERAGLERRYVGRERIDAHEQLAMPGHDDNVVANLAYAASGSLVHTVLVDGRVVVRGGRVLTMDEERVMREMQREAPRFMELAGTWDREHWPKDHTASHVFDAVAVRGG